VRTSGALRASSSTRQPAAMTASDHQRHPVSDEAAPGLSDALLRQLRVQRGPDGLDEAGVRRGHARQSIEEIVPGQVVETPHGTCFVLERLYDVGYVHGAHKIGALEPASRPSPALARLCGDPRLTELDYGSAIFLDIETTGLGIGAGLFAFLVGLGTLEPGGFVLRQYFMRDYGEEAALLHLLAQQLSEAKWWISFNGRSFDLPVLQTRFICGQRSMPLAEAPHMDLLHPARRLWRRRLHSCRLAALESNVLGLGRECDVPGWLIPEIYFDYLRFGEAAPLGQVFLHNALDILSLVTLTAQSDRLVRDPPALIAAHPVDRLSVALIRDSWKHWREAQEGYERALQDGLPGASADEGLRQLARLYKRTGRPERAEPLWEALARRGQPHAHLELAKYHEHRRKDFSAAARHVVAALAASGLPEAGACSRTALRKRLARLRQKMGKEGLDMAHIDSYAFGRIRVDGHDYRSDLLILPGEVQDDWWRAEGHRLQPVDLQAVVDAGVSLVVIGTGNIGRMRVPQETLDFLQSQGIRTIVVNTSTACEEYNKLAQDQQVGAALHLTC